MIATFCTAFDSTLEHEYSALKTFYVTLQARAKIRRIQNFQFENAVAHLQTNFCHCTGMWNSQEEGCLTNFISLLKYSCTNWILTSADALLSSVIIIWKVSLIRITNTFGCCFSRCYYKFRFSWSVPKKENFWLTAQKKQTVVLITVIYFAVYIFRSRLIEY